MIRNQPNQTIAPTALKRIHRDLKEINDNPLPGISVCMPNENDPLTLHGNIYIMDGPYRDMLIHIIVHLPPDYPITGPAVNIAPGLKFNNRFHEHLIDDDLHGSHICTDLLTNMTYMYEEGKKQKSGWTPAYTLSAALIQLQVFFAEPDLPRLPSPEDIEALRKHVKDFKMTITLSGGNTIVHSSENPYPPVQLNLPQKENQIIPNKDMEEEIKEPDVRKESEQWLKCAISKCTIFDESKPILGYPLDISKDRYGRYWPTPILEMISYDSFVQNIANNPEKLDNFEGVKFKSSFGEPYNFWIPVYLNEEHYQRGRQHVLNAISTVCKGFYGVTENDFKPHMILQVLPVILNKMIVKILKGELHQSVAAIQAYAHFYRLMMKLLEEFPEVKNSIDGLVDNMKRGENQRSKENLGDMGEFLIKLGLSKYGLKDPEINELLIEEYLARHVFWILKDEPGFTNRNHTPKSFVQGCVKHARISHQIYVVAVETANLMISDISLTHIDMRNGLLPKPLMDEYLIKIDWIRKNVAVDGNWEILCQSFNLDKKFTTEMDMANLLLKAFEISARQGYTQRYRIHLSREEEMKAENDRRAAREKRFRNSSSSSRSKSRSRSRSRENRRNQSNLNRMDDRGDRNHSSHHRIHVNRYENQDRHQNNDRNRSHSRDRHRNNDRRRSHSRDRRRNGHRRDSRSHSRGRDDKRNHRRDDRSHSRDRNDRRERREEPRTHHRH